jgi:hypothetical protein
LTDLELNQSPANDQLENSRVKRTDLVHNQDEVRDEAKEDEYDYFNLDGQPIPGANSSEQEENAEGRLDYHVMDDGVAGQNNEDDEEMLDDDEIRERNQNMLKELYDKIERDEGSHP